MDKEIRLPRTLKTGDTVAVVSPSAPGVARWPHRTERGRQYLESLGLRVKFMPHSQENHGLVSAPAQHRAADIMEAFEDDSVSAIIAAIGGNYSREVLPHLDFNLIADHPKIFQGYSDATTLLWAIWKHTRMITLYGPALLTNLAEYPKPLTFTDFWLRTFWFASGPIHFQPADTWTDEFLNFDTKDDLKRPRHQYDNGKWVDLRPGQAEGRILAGCLETIAHDILDDAHCPDFAGTILAVELSDESPSIPSVEASLEKLNHAKGFAQIQGLLVGRPARYSAADRNELWDRVRALAAAYDIPALGNLDFGHSDPFCPLPIGTRVQLSVGGPRGSMLQSVESATWNGIKEG
ncbi:LD-carboxypeptidase [Sulfobacillus sp. DSM 109850]|uniref:LD-carboxypeptidase n=1 Tax=Sulfobacillus harzensis TaxID=2729629 RepID=A0A7Y0L3F4_9FIRM|nr:LD-carboxypeptidase [Sulfobacillus harzensis]